MTFLHTWANLTSEQLVMILSSISIFSIFCGMSVLVVTNPVISIVYLIGLFTSISAYLILIGYHFIGLVYLVVYIGAISVLFIFILMLLNVRMSELEDLTTLNCWPLAIYVILALNYPLFIYSNNDISITSWPGDLTLETIGRFDAVAFSWLVMMYTANTQIRRISRQVIYRASGPDWDGNLSPGNNISTLGSVMYTDYNIWLFLASIILLLAMVGCIVITKKKSRTAKYLARSGVGLTGALSWESEAENLNEAVKQHKEAEREVTVSDEESARFAEQGKSEAAAEAAQDAQEWREEVDKLAAAINFYSKG